MLEFLQNDDELLEREMPYALQAIAVQLAAGQSFETSLKTASRGFGTAGRKLATALSQIETGAGVHKALQNLADSTKSLAVKRCCAQITFAYEHGGGSDALEQAAGQMAAEHQARLREYNSRASFLSIVFVAVSCVLPALAAAYLVIGSSFLDAGATPLQATLLFLLAFPLCDALLLAALYRLAPVETAS